jgi:predicted AAA+ superfamily ATPase
MISSIFDLQNPWRRGGDVPFDLRPRDILALILENLSNRKILGLVGSRQVGKSSLLFLMIRHLLDHDVHPGRIFYFNLDDLKLHELFSDKPAFVDFISPDSRERSYVFIDEIQRLSTPGLFLKALHDLGLNLKIVYSGSSQLEISSKMKEHLVGRARQFEIPRLSFSECRAFRHPVTREEALSGLMIFGGYPEVALTPGETDRLLAIKDIYQSYVGKDLVEHLQVRDVDGFNRILALLAGQIGNLLNVEGLARSARIPRHRVEDWLSILEQTFVIRRVYPFHRNYGKELTKTPKLFFMDLGLRNFILDRFMPLDRREDIGALFENLVLLELLAADPHGLSRFHYWRTTNQTEIDFIITRGEAITAIETKWRKSAPPKGFRSFVGHYPEAETRLVSREDFWGGSDGALVIK